MSHDQHVVRTDVLLRLANRRSVEARADVLDQLIKPLAYILRRPDAKKGVESVTFPLRSLAHGRGGPEPSAGPHTPPSSRPSMQSQVGERASELSNWQRGKKPDLEKYENKGGQVCKHSLSAWTPILPDIPRLLATFSALLADLSAGQALVVAVVPLADGVRHLDAGVGTDEVLGRIIFFVLLPRHALRAAERQQLEGALGALAGRDVTRKRPWRFCFSRAPLFLGARRTRKNAGGVSHRAAFAFRVKTRKVA